MPIQIDSSLTPKKLLPLIFQLFELSAEKIRSLEKSWKPRLGTPVFTVDGKYTTRGWTEWTQGFQFGSAILQFDATSEESFLSWGRNQTVKRMASHVSHIGVHDHGFNNISTYGNLLRLMHEGKVAPNDREKDFYELALKVSGAVQASRWTKLSDGTGFIHSFNGPHSLFVDTIRSLRVLGVAHQLGHCLMGEQDEKISLGQRLLEHGRNTARYSVFYGEKRDAYDIPGRTAHECLFNTTNGVYRCPNTQQGYSPFSTWTRGLAWALCGFAEQLEFLRVARIPGNGVISVPKLQPVFLKAATATADFYLENSCRDGIPMWDTGAPNLHRLKNHLNKVSNPYNDWEPVDSSAAAIAAQGLIRLGNYLVDLGRTGPGKRYRQAGLTTAQTLMSKPYLSTHSKHQGLLLHSIYHLPNGWDHVAHGQKIPNGESSQWGDYHLRELALLILRQARNEPYLTFFKT